MPTEDSQDSQKHKRYSAYSVTNAEVEQLKLTSETTNHSQTNKLEETKVNSAAYYTIALCSSPINSLLTFCHQLNLYGGICRTSNSIAYANHALTFG